MALSSYTHTDYRNENAAQGFCESLFEQGAPLTDGDVSLEDIGALRQQSNRMQHLLEVMPAGVVVLDANGYIRQANQQAAALLGEPLEGERWRNIIKRSFRPRADDGHEVSLVDGRRVKLSITPLKDEPGQLILLTDLTETRQLQARVSHMQRLSSLGNMVASLAHQIRTPLSAAMLYGMNLSNASLPQAAKQAFTDKLLSRLRDLEHQVNDMLVFAKSGDNQVVETLSLQALLKEVQAGSEAMLANHGTSLMVSLPEPDILVLGNQTALASALQNLIHNALQITSQHAKTDAQPTNAQVELSAMRDEQDPDKVNISVKDNGPGFPVSVIQQAFEPFFTTKSNGTGLGLAVVKAVAQSHHGEAFISNQLTGGACVTIQLPIECAQTMPSKDALCQSTEQPAARI